MAFMSRKHELPCSAACRADIVLTEPPENLFHPVGRAETCNTSYRSVMEDAMSVGYVTRLSGWRIAIYCVFDGHGNGQSARWCGDHMLHLVAAHIATLHEQSRAGEDGEATPALVQGLPAVLDSAFRDADEMLTPVNVGQSGTTATVALIAESESGRRWLVVANAGDSAALYAWPGRDGVTVLKHLDYALPYDRPVNSPRQSPPSDGSLGTVPSRSPGPDTLHLPHIHHLSRGSCLFLNADHRATDRPEVTRVRECGGTIYDSRVHGMLAVTRSLGDHVLGPCVSARPAVSVTAIQPRPESTARQSAWLLLSCDGLFDFCSFKAAALALLNSDSRSDPGAVAQKIVGDALRAKSTDNVSVLAVRVDYS